MCSLFVGEISSWRGLRTTPFFVTNSHALVLATLNVRVVHGLRESTADVIMTIFRNAQALSVRHPAFLYDLRSIVYEGVGSPYTVNGQLIRPRVSTMVALRRGGSVYVKNFYVRTSDHVRNF